MSPTIKFELVIAVVGIMVAVLAMYLHGSDLVGAAMLITVLAAYAAWLDRRP